MNKAFEKILERLEERRKLHSDLSVSDKLSVEEQEVQSRLCGCFSKAKQIVQEVEAEYNNGWIPVKTRPMTGEEKEYYSKYHFEGNGMIYECHLPDDGQEVLITSKYGNVEKTTFWTDDGNYFENYEDYDEVIAWQPCPESYTGS